jgi:UPF0755 protein
VTDDEGEQSVALSRGSKGFLAFVVVALAGVGGGLLWLDGRLTGDDDDDETAVLAGQPVEVTVEPGQSVRSVGEELVELGVLARLRPFLNAAEDANLPARLQPGIFELETGMDPGDAVDVFMAGPVNAGEGRFTVQEGLPVEVVLERLAAQFEAYDESDFRAVLDERIEAGENADGVLRLPDWVPEPAEAGDEVIEPFEGVLFPETYEVASDATPLQILQRMVDQLERVMDGVDGSAVQAAADRGIDRYQALILASLIERETRVDGERRTVSGVIENRLEESMRLQIDATVLYARGEHTDRVLFEDTEIDSPYNTYQVDGLPPTPISGAGRAAIEAAFDPEDVTYRYYVLDPACDGTHVFADTLDEHNVNVRAFRDAGGCR